MYSSSGPRQAEMSGVNEKIVTVKKLLEGHYAFKLTVTDDKGLTGSDTVAVNVKKGESVLIFYGCPMECSID